MWNAIPASAVHGVKCTVDGRASHFRRLSLRVIGTLAIAVGCVFNVNAQALSACPNPVVGARDGAASAVYSDCTMEVGSNVYHVGLYEGSGGNVGSQGYLAPDLSPLPAGDEPVGQFDGVTLQVEDFGVGYTGTCAEMTSTSPSLPLADQHVYCGRIGNTEGNFVFARGTWNAGTSTFSSPLVVTNQPGVGTPLAQAVTAVPSLSLFALLGLSGLMGWVGLRRVKG